MPLPGRWRGPAGGRPLRLHVLLRCPAAGLVRAPATSHYHRAHHHRHHHSHPRHRASSPSATGSSSANSSSGASSRVSAYPLHHSRPSLAGRSAAQALLQRRVYQTFSPATTTTTTAATTTPTPASLALPPFNCRSLLSSCDLPPSHPLSFSTFSRASSSTLSSTLASTLRSTSSSSSSSSSYSSSSPRKQRRRLARWLPAIMAVQATQTRAHSDDAHSHKHGLLGGHHHHHDNVYLMSQNKHDAGVRITRLGLYCNLGMAFAKGAGGYLFNSQAMVADAWHSLTDLASDVLTLATVSWSLRPPTDRFPAGFGKVESLGSLGVSGMLLGGGIFMCISSLQSLHAHFFLDAAAAAEVLAHGHGHGHSHSHIHVGAPSLHAAWLALGTVLVKEWLYRATMKVARERKSSVLASNAVHHRVDSLTGIVTLLAILGANLIHDASWLDPVGGLFISLLVIRAGWSNTASALYELADRSIDDDVKRAVRAQVAKALSDDLVGVIGGAAAGETHPSSSQPSAGIELRDVSGVKSGQNYLVDLELAVPGDWTVETVRAVEEAVRARVGHSVRGVRRIRVRFVKLDETVEKFDEFLQGSPRASPEPEAEPHDHDHDHGHGNGHDHDHDHGHGHNHTKGKHEH